MKILCMVSLLVLFTSCSNELPTVPEKAVPAGFTAVAVDETEWLRNSTAPPNGGWNPAFSPDGQKVAFLSSTLHTPDDLWVMQADGTEPRRLTSRGVISFKWSEDSTTILLKTVRKGFEEVLSISPDGSRETRIPGLPPGSSVPAYSPDGSLFAITVPGEQNTRDLWIGTADGKRLEAVTEKIGIRSVFWHPDSRIIYYEAGKTYGVGIWQVNLATMESSSLVANYIGPPVYSDQTKLVAYAFPTNPGQYDVRTMQLNGSEHGSCAAPRLTTDRTVTWDAAGKGVYYIGQDLEEITDSPGVNVPETAPESLDEMPNHDKAEKTTRRVGVNALWRLDLETCVEERVSPPEIHLAGFTFSQASGGITLSGVLQGSYNTELFSFDPAVSELKQLFASRMSSWLPVPSVDSSKIAFFTNQGFLDTLQVASLEGEALISYPGVAQEGDTRIFWLPRSEGMLIFSSRGLMAFNEKGPIEFATREDHRAGYMGIDVSIQEDKVLLNSIPRYGQNPGLYMLEAVDNVFVQTDLRFPTVAGELAADQYMQPRWSMDGSHIAFTDLSDVWSMKADGTDRRWLTDYMTANKDEKNTPALVSYPIWSSQGEMLSFALTVYEEKSIHRQIWVMKADGTDARMLYSQELNSQAQVYLPEYTSLPFFDYDDTKIIFTAPHGGILNIFSVGLADGKVTMLTEDGAIFPALLPEEDLIIYTSFAGNTEQLMTMNSDGTGKKLFIVKEKSEE